MTAASRGRTFGAMLQRLRMAKTPDAGTAPRQGESDRTLGRLGRWAAVHRRAVVTAWVAVAVCLGVFAPRAEHALSGGGWQADASESVNARRVIDRHFDGQGSYALAVVVSSRTHDS